MSLKMSLKTACCKQSLERGSFYAGIYTLTFYTVLVIIGALHLNLIDEDQDKDYLLLLRAVCSVLLLFSGTCVVSSIFLIIGVCVESRRLFLPWMISIGIMTIFDVFVCLFIIAHEPTVFNQMVIIFILCDSFICILNIYLLVVVFSLYRQLSKRDSDSRLALETSKAFCVIVDAASPSMSGSDILPSRRDSSLASDGNFVSQSFPVSSSSHGNHNHSQQLQDFFTKSASRTKKSSNNSSNNYHDNPMMSVMNDKSSSENNPSRMSVVSSCLEQNHSQVSGEATSNEDQGISYHLSDDEDEVGQEESRCQINGKITEIVH